jgi:hypothetical protein
MADEFTPSLAQVIRDSIDAKLLDTHTCMPGQVVKYDSSKNMVDVQPVLKITYENGDVNPLPVITNVPVQFLRSGKAFISVPIKAGDYVTLVFAERSLDIWASQGGVVDPDDVRKHHLTDAIALPGVYPFSDPAPAHEDNILIKNDTSEIQLTPDGKFILKGAADEEVMTIMYDLLQVLINALVITAIGPQPFFASTVTALTAIQMRISQLKGS